MADPASTTDAETPPTGERPLTDAARRALEEAAARRAAYERAEAELTRERELRGRGGPDPVRYGDWEVKGLTSDF